MFFPDFVVFAARFVLVFSFLETTLFVFSTLFGVYILLGVLLISISEPVKTDLWEVSRINFV